jgi:hypothetical protein
MEDGCGNQPVDQAQDSTQLDFFPTLCVLRVKSAN